MYSYFFIVDSFGARYATIKAACASDALKIYANGMPADVLSVVDAVPAQAWNEYALNTQNL